VSNYPIATALLATPIMAPEILYRQATAPPTAAAWIGHAQHMEKYAAAIITLVSVVLFALLCQAIGFPYPLTIGLSLFYALGSQAFCTRCGTSSTARSPGPSADDGCRNRNLPAHSLRPCNRSGRPDGIGRAS
jgi:hypothetical protein